MPNLVKLTVNLTPRSAAALDLAAETTEDSKTDIVNRALQIYAYLVSTQDGIIGITDESGEPKVMNILL